VPFPPDYGGVIDVFNRIKQLKENGYIIILHCFEYHDRSSKQNIDELKKYCKEVYIYHRNKSLFLFFNKLPFIVISRRNDELLNNLLQNNFPILFEGIHTTAFISHTQLKHRIKILRTHNIEPDYYYHLAKSTNHILKKWYYKTESKKLKRYEPIILPLAQKVLAISEADKQFFEKLNPETLVLLPSVDTEKNIKSISVEDKFILFHGNLSVNENEKAALFLIDHVFSKIATQVVIAGKQPSKLLQKAVKLFSNIRLIASPDDEAMQVLIATAHIHVLYSFQETGIKLKLLNVLQNGKFCIANNLIVGSLPVSDMIEIANTPSAILSVINKLLQKNFDNELILKRQLFLNTLHEKNEYILRNLF